MAPDPDNASPDETASSRTMETVIAEHPFLRGMTPVQLELLAQAAMRRQYPAGELIFREGDPANRFYLIEEGKVALEATGRDEPAVLIETIGSGDVLGWSWLFPPYYWHFSARTLEPTKTIFFYGTPLRDQCEEDPALGYELIKRMSQVVIMRLQSARKRLLDRQ